MLWHKNLQTFLKWKEGNHSIILVEVLSAGLEADVSLPLDHEAWVLGVGWMSELRKARKEACIRVLQFLLVYCLF